MTLSSGSALKVIGGWGGWLDFSVTQVQVLRINFEFRLDLEFDLTWTGLDLTLTGLGLSLDKCQNYTGWSNKIGQVEWD